MQYKVVEILKVDIFHSIFSVSHDMKLFKLLLSKLKVSATAATESGSSALSPEDKRTTHSGDGPKRPDSSRNSPYDETPPPPRNSNDKGPKGTGDYAPSPAFNPPPGEEPAPPQEEKGARGYARANPPSGQQEDRGGTSRTEVPPQDSEFVLLVTEMARRVEPALPPALRVEVIKLMRSALSRQ